LISLFFRPGINAFGLPGRNLIYKEKELARKMMTIVQAKGIASGFKAFTFLSWNGSRLTRQIGKPLSSDRRLGLGESQQWIRL